MLDIEKVWEDLTSPKILILVLSFTDEPYLSLMRSQQNSWDSIDVEGVKTVYYYGGGKGWVNEKEFSADASDAYYTMAHKCIEAMKAVDIYSFDVIYRVNSSAYVNKQKLKEFAETLPKEKLYGGWEIEGNAGYNVVSGSGIFLSPDVAKILIEHTDINREREEDVLFAEVLFNHGISILDDKSRYDVPITIPPDFPTNRFSYRLKTTSNRLADIGNMKAIHKLITA